MSTKEMALIARIVKTGEIGAALEFGVTTDDFLSAETKQLWSVIHSYHMNPATSGSVLEEDLIRSQFSGFMIPDDTWSRMTTPALCHEVRKERIKAVSLYQAHEFAKTVAGDGNLTTALNALSAQLHGLLALGVAGNTDVDMHRSIDNYLTRAKLIQAGHDLSVMRWPWEALQKATLGIQKEDYIVFFGRPKNMKTWVLCYTLAWAFMQEKRILVYTKEMTPDQLFLRTACCICELPYDEARGARLTEEQEAALIKVRNMNADPMWGGSITALNAKDAPPGGDSVSWLRGKVDKYRPALLFIDGMYLLSDEHGSRAQKNDVRVMNISRALRNLNLETEVPIFATMQANRKAAGHGQANLDELAYSDAISQDATLLMRTIADKTTPERPTQTISLVVGGAREFKLHGFRINGVPATDFSQHSILTEADIEKAKEDDASEAESKTPKRRKKPIEAEAPAGEVPTNGKSVRRPVYDTDSQVAKALAAMGLQTNGLPLA